jgi:sugar O-acyltransferase (sialic acid O-acetyltransferase NeuD family)
MKPLLIIGSGDHALVVADIARAAGRDSVRLADPEADWDLGERPDGEFVVAIGRNDLRARFYGAALALGLAPVTLVHPSAILLGGSAVGSGCQVCAGAVIGVEARVGTNVIVNTGATIDHHDQLGDHTFVGPGAHLAGRVTVGSSAHIGIGATVREGVTIGAAAYIAAGAVVIDDVPAGERWAGVPARPMAVAAMEEPA